MNFYENEGTDAIVDLRAAAAELKGSASVTNDTTRRQIVAEIQTAALLDIALSLRVVAAEARAAMPDPTAYEETTPNAPEDGRDRDFLIEGDLVVVDGMDEPGEVIRFGESEGSVYAVVALANGAEIRPWLEAVHRLVGDERDDDTMQEATERIVETVGEMTLDREGEILAGADDEPEDDIEIGEVVAVELAAEIDDDFEGDHHTAAATALDTLKANEAERKAAKKSKKGGKK